MDALVQFLRNAMCCVKDLNLLSNTFLYDASWVQHYLLPSSIVPLPSPLNETTPLEVAISISQFYAFWSTSRAGYSLILNSWNKWNYLRNHKQQLKLPSTSSTSSSSSSSSAAAIRLVQERFTQSQNTAWRNFIIGLNVLPIGIAFFWLFANSWHVTSTPWLGGMQGVIHALTVMELCLLPLLYYMLTNAQEWLQRASQFRKLAQLIQAGNLTSDDITVQAYQAMNGESWTPYWENTGNNDNNKDDDKSGDAEKLFQQEVERIQRTLEPLLKAESTNGKDASAASAASGEKEDKIRNEARLQAAALLQSQAKTLSWEGYREYLYFCINFIAFYGYLLGVVCYYTTDYGNDNTTTQKEAWYVRNLKLGMSHESADWHGNFAGDLMWTIEPLIILGSPSLIRNLTKDPSKQPDSSKVKSE